MRGAWIIYRRELEGLFLRPMAWVLLFLAMIYQGAELGLRYVPMFRGDVDAALMFVLGSGEAYWLFMILLPPLLTMRMVSEEASSGLLEFLLTAPVRDSAVLAGKLAAATTFMVILWSSAFAYALTFEWLGTTPPGGVDWGAVWTGYLGAVLVSGFFCSVGLAVSSIVATPIVAGFMSLVVNLTLVLVVPGVAYYGRLAPDHWLREVLVHFEVVSHVNGSFAIGAVDTRGVVFFVVWTVFFVFLATRFLEMRRWR